MMRRSGHLAILVVVLASNFFALPLAETADLRGGYLLAQAPPAAPPAAQVAVPTLVRQTPAEAANALGPLGLRLQVVGQVQTPNQALANRIAAQSPPPGTRVNRGTVVQVRVYRFAVAQVQVPSLVGRTTGDAEKALERQGLRLQVVGTVPTNDRERVGRIGEQDPPPGARVNRGTAVRARTFRIAMVTVPNLMRRTADEARAALGPLGLRLEFGQRGPTVPTRDPALRGRIAQQSPGAGAQVARGTTVRAQLFRVDEVTVPPIMRLTTAEAGDRLRRAGLSLQLGGEPVTTPVPGLRGRIAEQKPASGARVVRGTAVHARVFRVEQVTVPNVVGQPVGAAMQALSQAGLLGQQVGQVPPANPAQVGRVASQSPAAGARVDRGRTIQLRIYQRPGP